MDHGSSTMASSQLQALCTTSNPNRCTENVPPAEKEVSKYTRVNSTLLKVQDPNTASRELFADEAYAHLQKIPQKSVARFRDKKDHFHPVHLIMTVLPIPPNCVRPSPTMDGDEVRGEDDITRRLLYILRVAQSYKNARLENSVVREHSMKRTQNAIHMYFDQARMSTKATTAQKSIASRLRGKQGRLSRDSDGQALQLYGANCHHRRRKSRYARGRCPTARRRYLDDRRTCKPTQLRRHSQHDC